MITTALAGCFGNDQQQAPDDGDDLPEPIKMTGWCTTSPLFPTCQPVIPTLLVDFISLSLMLDSRFAPRQAGHLLTSLDLMAPWAPLVLTE